MYLVFCFQQFDYETLSGTKRFGPAFRLDFLLEALHLQHDIEAVSFFVF